MNLNYYFSRILHDRLKLSLLVLLIILPSLDIMVILESIIRYGIEAPVPAFGTFVSMYSLGHKLQSIFFWFIPIYLLIIVSEDSIEDASTGNKNVLISKIGRKSYFHTKVGGSFIFAFSIVFLALILNLLLAFVFFHEGTHIKTGGIFMPDNILFTFAQAHPLAANLTYIFTISFLCGVLGSFCTSLAIVLKDRKIVYGIAFIAWLAPIYMNPSLMIAMNPFNEYDFDIKLPLYISVLAEYILIIMVANVWENKIAKI